MLLRKVQVSQKTGGSSSSPSSPSTTGREEHKEEGPVQRKKVTPIEQTGPIKGAFTQEQVDMVNQLLKLKDYYKILSVERDASEADIKKAYKKVIYNNITAVYLLFKIVGNRLVSSPGGEEWGICPARAPPVPLPTEYINVFCCFFTCMGLKKKSYASPCFNL